jgi:hypothetical protein
VDTGRFALVETGFDPLRWDAKDLLVGCTGAGLLVASLMTWYTARWQADYPLPAGDVSGNGWTTSVLWTAGVVLGIAAAALWLYRHGRPSVPHWVAPVVSSATLVAVLLFGWQWFTLPESTYATGDREADVSVAVVVVADTNVVGPTTMAVDRTWGGARQPGFTSEIRLGCQLAALALAIQLVAVVRRRPAPTPDGHRSGAP